MTVLRFANRYGKETPATPGVMYEDDDRGYRLEVSYDGKDASQVAGKGTSTFICPVEPQESTKRTIAAYARRRHQGNTLRPQIVGSFRRPCTACTMQGGVN